MNFAPVAPSGLGALIAIVGLLLAIVFGVIGTIPVLVAVLFGMAFLARLC